MLLAFSALNEQCRPYLQRYFSASVRLPSDWLAVADLVQTFSPEETGLSGLDEAKPVESGSLPAALRRAMVGKFSDFDEYQLAKYNKPKSASKVSA